MDDTTTNQRLAGRYVLLDQLGAGGAGAVWRAHDEVLDRTVAVKLLHPELAREPETAARFRAEAAAAAKLTHPHAVVVYDIGQADEGDYLVMELVDGATLGDVLALGALPAGVSAAMGAQVARALGTAHGRGLVHRDVKPANVLITRDGVAKVADFGIARALGEATSRLTTPGQVVGTARYLAPEQLRDEQIDARADVYALGLLLHQSVTGGLPFGEGTAVEVASRRLIADGLPRASELVPGVPPALDDVIVRATALEPDDRYDDGADLAAALAPLVAPQAGAELAARVRRAPRTDPGRTPSGRGRSSAGAAAIPPAAPPAASPSPAPLEGEASLPDGLLAERGGTSAMMPVAGHGGPSPTDGTARHEAVQAAPASSPTPARGQGKRTAWLPWVLALAVLALGLWVVWPGAAPTPDTDGGDDEDTEVAEGETGNGALGIADAGDHDPGGSGSENPDQVGNAFDGDPATVWQTQGYDNHPTFGNLKDGVGIWLDLGDSHTLDLLTLTSAHPGYDLSIFVGDQPPSGGDHPRDWGEEVAGVSDGGESVEVELGGVEGRVVVVWFTSLGPDGGRFRGSIAEVAVHGG